ncbi:MAG TPA: GAF domain-containing protein [Ectothiorhodospiraceae bacterium]|nr:GAF domain-containing protein [Ectothiorhodospiraceae bacterium]
MSQSDQLLEKLEKLTEIGIALSSERDTHKLLELILLGAKEITRADGGTLYSVQEDNTIKMEIIRTDSLNYAMGGTTGNEIPFPPIPLFNEEGQPNLHMVVTNAVLLDSTINIPDAYHAEGFDFSGTKDFDEHTGYRSQSFLTVPLKNHENDIIGVLQLLNAIDSANDEVIPFSTAAQRLTESLASQAAIALTNRRLIDDLKALLESLIQLIATAIDEKSPYTGGHCERVPVLTMMLAEAANRQKSGPFKNFELNADGRYELNIAAWLHDCGKITTPEAVVDKATKLQTIFDRIELIEARFEILKRDAQIAALEERLKNVEAGDKSSNSLIESRLTQKLKQFEDDLEFLRHTNIGGEFMSEDDQDLVLSFGNQPLQIDGKMHTLLTEDEIYNLAIAKGTLTPEEREIINNHIVVTIGMLETLPFPKHLKNIPEFAGGHHEKMDGTGYPKGLKGEQMSVQARMMAIADIFEALTAKDRPYKEGKKLSETLKILGLMCINQHIDPDLFRLFMDEQLYLKYAKEYLDPAQIDEINTADIPGYR